MILQLLGIIAIIVFTVFVGKTAKEYGRNAVLWAVACLGVGLGLQFVGPILVVMIVAIVLIATGTRPDQLETAIGWWGFGITFLFLVLSLIGMFIILRHVAQLLDEPEIGDSPPPPPTFNQN